MGTQPMDRREHGRIAADLSAVCRVPATPHRARVLDVSESGCRIHIIDSVAISSGATVHLDFGPGRRVSGQVMWSGARSAGVRFTRCLSPAMAAMLGLSEEPQVEVEVVAAPEPNTRQGPFLAHWLRRLLARAS